MDKLSSIKAYLQILDNQSPSTASDSDVLIAGLRNVWDSDENKPSYNTDFVNDVNSVFTALSNEFWPVGECWDRLQAIMHDEYNRLKIEPSEDIANENKNSNSVILTAFHDEIGVGMTNEAACEMVASKFIMRTDEVIEIVKKSGVVFESIQAKPKTTMVSECSVYIAKHDFYISEDGSSWIDEGTMINEVADGRFFRIMSGPFTGTGLVLEKEELERNFKIDEKESKKLSNEAWQKINEAYDQKSNSGAGAFTSLLVGKGMANDYTVSTINNMYKMYKPSLDESLVQKVDPILEKWREHKATSKETFYSLQEAFGIGVIIEGKGIPADMMTKINAEFDEELKDARQNAGGDWVLTQDEGYNDMVLDTVLNKYGYTLADYYGTEQPMPEEKSLNEEWREKESSINLFPDDYPDAKKGWTVSEFTALCDKNGTDYKIGAKDESPITKIGDKVWYYTNVKYTAHSPKAQSELSKSTWKKTNEEYVNEAAKPTASPELLEREKALNAKGKIANYNKSKTDFCYIGQVGNDFALYDSTGAEIERGKHVACINAKNEFLKEDKVFEFVRKSGSKWKVYSRKGKVLGTHDTKEDADNQLAAIEANKAHEGKAEAKHDVTITTVDGKKKISYKKGDMISWGNAAPDDMVLINIDGNYREVYRKDVDKATNESIVNEGKENIAEAQIIEDYQREYSVSQEEHKNYSGQQSCDQAVEIIANRFDMSKDDVKNILRKNKVEKFFESIVNEGPRPFGYKADHPFFKKLAEIDPNYKEKHVDGGITTYHDSAGKIIGQIGADGKKQIIGDTTIYEMIGDPDYFYDDGAAKGSVNGYSFSGVSSFADMPIIEDINAGVQGVMDSIKAGKHDHTAVSKMMDEEPYCKLTPECRLELQSLFNSYHEALVSGEDPKEIEAELMGFINPKKVEDQPETIHEDDDESKKVTKAELENVLATMNRYNRTSGFMDKVDGKLTFFDGQPNINDVGGAPVTKDELVKWIADYDANASDALKEGLEGAMTKWMLAGFKPRWNPLSLLESINEASTKAEILAQLRKELGDSTIEYSAIKAWRGFNDKDKWNKVQGLIKKYDALNESKIDEDKTIKFVLDYTYGGSKEDAEKEIADFISKHPEFTSNGKAIHWTPEKGYLEFDISGKESDLIKLGKEAGYGDDEFKEKFLSESKINEDASPNAAGIEKLKPYLEAARKALEQKKIINIMDSPIEFPDQYKDEAPYFHIEMAGEDSADIINYEPDGTVMLCKDILNKDGDDVRDISLEAFTAYLDSLPTRNEQGMTADDIATETSGINPAGERY